MRKLRPLVVAAALATVVPVLTTNLVEAAGWKEQAEAKKHITTAKGLEKDKKWAEAQKAYEEAIALAPTADARLALANALAQQGKVLEALEQVETVLQDPKLSWHLKKQAEKARTTLDAKLVKVTIKVPEGFAGKVKVSDREMSPDELAAPISLNPGPVSVQATQDGFLPFHAALDLTEGGSQEVVIAMKTKPKAAAKVIVDDEPDVPKEESSGGTRKFLTYTALGVGTAGLIVGSVFGVMARSSRNKLSDACPEGVCPESERGAYDSGKSQATISTIGFIVGGVGLGAGAYLLFTGGSSKGLEAKGEVGAYVGPSELGLQGTF